MAPAIVVATRNPGKLRELRAMFETHGLALEDLSAAGLGTEDPAEDGLEVFETFEANARAKARWFAARLQGRVVIAEDSGLEVHALSGAPGVRSKRWSGSSATGPRLDAENNDALLRALDERGVRAPAARGARYVSVVVCAQGAREWVARGECGGRILEEADGAEGFGYDPIFWSEELGKSFGRATRAEKSRVSHRGRAFAGLLARLVGDGVPWVAGGVR